MPFIFRCKTNEAYRIKILAELLSNNIKTGCFVVDEKGIYLRMMDHHRSIMIDLNLKADNFNLFKLEKESKLYLGINMAHFHRLAKSIKKKDIMELFIDEEAPNDLGIKVIPKENNRVTTSYIKIQNVQNIDIDVPTGYSRPVIISSAEYQKLVKEMNTLGNTMKVTATKFFIEFSCDTGGILKRSVQFGEIDDSSKTDSKDLFCQEYVTEQLCRITKLAGFSNDIQIFTGKPLLFSSNVGSLGKISIFIKSKDQIENEIHKHLEDSDSD
jgi:proliferating cell nuclear antigen